MAKMQARAAEGARTPADEIRQRMQVTADFLEFLHACILETGVRMINEMAGFQAAVA